MEVLDPLAQCSARRSPGQQREIGPPQVIHQCGGRFGARRGTALGAAELDRAEPPLDTLDEVAPVDVPDERSLFDDVAAEAGDHVDRIERGGEPDPRPSSPAIEVGGDDERLRAERIVVGQPRRLARPELELARPATAGDPVGIGQQQRGAGAVDVDRVEVEPDAGAPGEVGRPVADAEHGATVGGVVGRRAGDHADAQRQVGGEVVGSTTEHVALVDDRGDDAGQRRLLDRHHPCQSRVDGEPEHRSAERGDRATLPIDGRPGRWRPGRSRAGRRAVPVPVRASAPVAGR